MSNRRSKRKLEERLARKYVYQNSTSKCRSNDPDEVREKIFLGNASDVEKYVLAEIKGEREGAIPEYPQGLVFSDNRGCGFFDVNPL